ncbi:TetR family transcriptional regulator [Nocardioides pantholopis]|uniref:TetR family transcriptional regulator n=1 Tax=Nocardioides pantholopis TaxID=2483798 RepID=UPI000F07BC36|nr:TetR family transcriptional regulator [Nocardioides pantholopis]
MPDHVNAHPGGTPSGTQRGDARDRLLQAAVAAFAAKGFHGTTTRDIAAAAGMSPAALYVHHRSKEELLHQISLAGHERTLALCRAAVEGSDDPVEQLGRLVTDYVRYHAVHHTTARILNYELAALSPEHQAEIGAIRSRIDVLLRELLERGRRSGALRVPHPTVTAAAILSLGIDLARWWREDGGWTPDQVAAYYRELVLAMVGIAS